MTIKVSKDDCLNVAKALGLEWLDTNGRGGYAMSTVLGCNTRKYHGLLVARLQQPAGKFVLLSKVEDSLVYDDKELFLSAHQYQPAVIFPRGHKYLGEFKYKYLPRFKYTVGGTTVHKQVAMVSGEDAVMMRYIAKKNRTGAKLRIKPLIAYRDFHGLSKENLFLRVRCFPTERGCKMSPYEGMPDIFFQTNGRFEFFPAPAWFRNFEYYKEFRRGFEGHEDLFCPGMFEIEFPEGEEVVFVASLRQHDEDLDAMWEREYERRKKLSRRLRGDEMQKSLGRAAEQFFTRNERGQTGITAGFPWFLEWGRDAMIALPGLARATGNNERYLQVLTAFAENQKDGLIPNFLGATEELNAYNSVDAGLWFAWAVQQYLLDGGQVSQLESKILPALEKVFRGYRDGTAPLVKMRGDGLLEVGSAEHNLTWMDAQVGGVPVTPRHGCPVEICALWFNLVSFLSKLGQEHGYPVGAEAGALVDTIRASFNEAFWLEDETYLADVLVDGRRDVSVRPNQIFAASLPHSPLEAAQALAVIDKVRRELVTPYGLRTLSPADPNFVPRYEGGPEHRDAAYHQGTVWPWLLGAYGESLLKWYENKTLAIEELEGYLEKLEEHLEEMGLGTIAEVFDGNPPRSPHGCPSQAWSVAEIYRLSKLVQDEKARVENSSAPKTKKRA